MKKITRRKASSSRKKRTKNKESIKNIRRIDSTHLLEKYSIGKIGLLKIDTEGHDAAILSEFVDLWKKGSFVAPDNIVYEKNCLSDDDSLEQCRLNLEELGFVRDASLSRNSSEIGYNRSS